MVKRRERGETDLQASAGFVFCRARDEVWITGCQKQVSFCKRQKPEAGCHEIFGENGKVDNSMRWRLRGTWVDCGAPGWSKFPSWDFWRIQFDEDVCRWVPSFSKDGWKLMLLDEQCNVEIRADEGGYDDGGGYEGGGGWRMLACRTKSGQLFIAWLISEMSSKVWRF